MGTKDDGGGGDSLSGLTTILPGGPGLAGTRMSRFWISLELRIMEVAVTTAALPISDPGQVVHTRASCAQCTRLKLTTEWHCRNSINVI